MLKFSPYRAVNILRLSYKNQVILYREIIAVSSEIDTKHINALCGQNVEFVKVKPGGTYSDHWEFKGLISSRYTAPCYPSI